MRTTRAPFIITALTLAGAALAACSGPATDDAASSPGAVGGTVTVLTHDSFAVPDELVAAFEAETGIALEFVTAGDGGALTNQLILTKEAPLADVVYGIDNTFASRVASEGVLEPYVSTEAAATSAVATSSPAAEGLTAIDFSDVCLNVDLTYFESRGIAVPQTFEDLLDPAYRDLVVVTNPATSSPGLAFLLATVDAYGDEWPAYWQGLKDNGLRVASSWSDAYFVDFSAPNYGGDRPIVLSYASSPPSEVIDGEPTTAALLQTCFRQVEYAGVIAGTDNPAGSRAVIDWMLTDDFQEALPASMYVYPISDTATIPDDWRALAPLSPQPWSLDPDAISLRRDELVLEWTDLVLG